jgi:hypothetical protein
MVWGSDDHRVDRLVVHDRAVVARRLRRVAGHLFDPSDSASQNRIVDVTQGDGASSVIGSNLPNVMHPDAVDPNQGDGNLIVR